MTVGKGGLDAVLGLIDQIKANDKKKPRILTGDAYLVHTCTDFKSEYEGYAPIVGNGQIHCRAGMSFISNANGASQVIFCPWCGIEVHELGLKVARDAAVQYVHANNTTPAPAPAPDAPNS